MTDDGTPIGAADDGPGYIRGSGAVVIEGRRIIAIVVIATLATLAVLAILLTIAAIEKNDRIDRLHHRGVAVDVTVTSCLGLASGTGITTTGYRCRGSFTLASRHYDEVIGSSNALLQPGTVVKGIVDPRDPANLAAAGAATAAKASRKAFVIPAIPTLLFLVLLAVMWRPLRRGQSRSPSSA